MLRNHLERMQPSHVPEASCPNTTRQGDRNREPAPPTRDACLQDQSLRAQQYIILRRSHGQVTKVTSLNISLNLKHTKIDDQISQKI